MNRLFVVLALSFGLSSFANAADLKSTITGGYAQSDVEFMGEELNDYPNGFNVKYRLEFNEELGVIASYTNTSYDESVAYGSNGTASVSLDYQSFMVGPTFRANDYFSAYLMVGAAVGEAKGSVTGLGSEKLKETEVGVGGGVQFNIAEHFTIDASYEYSDIDDVRVGTWVVGAGISF